MSFSSPSFFQNWKENESWASMDPLPSPHFLFSPFSSQPNKDNKIHFSLFSFSHFSFSPFSLWPNIALGSRHHYLTFSTLTRIATMATPTFHSLPSILPSPLRPFWPLPTSRPSPPPMSAPHLYEILMIFYTNQTIKNVFEILRLQTTMRKTSHFFIFFIENILHQNKKEAK